MSNVVVGGLEELKKAFNELPKEFHRTALRPAVSAAAGVVQRAAKIGVPKDTGRLAKSIYRARDKTASNQVQEAAIVGVRFGRKYRKRGQDAWYFIFLEFGTKKMAAQPFLRPAFEATKSLQLKVIQEKLKIGLEKATAKARSKFK